MTGHVVPDDLKWKSEFWSKPEHPNCQRIGMNFLIRVSRKNYIFSWFASYHPSDEDRHKMTGFSLAVVDQRETEGERESIMWVGE